MVAVVTLERLVLLLGILEGIPVAEVIGAAGTAGVVAVVAVVVAEVRGGEVRAALLGIAVAGLLLSCCLFLLAVSLSCLLFLLLRLLLFIRWSLSLSILTSSPVAYLPLNPLLLVISASMR